jgi:hypothetical protein
MKPTTMVFGLVCTLLFACHDEQAPQTQLKESVQFSIWLAPGNDGGRTATAIPPGAIATVEISGPEGTVTESLEILAFGGDYLTSPIQLSTGSHKLLSFLITVDSEVLFAAPKEGSLVASAVDNPLPHSFDVHKGSIKNIPIQVVEVGANSPGDFGYASFGVTVVKPLAITVFIEQGGELMITNSSGYLESEDIAGPLQSFELPAKVNYIPFIGLAHRPHSITIEKPGYTSVEKHFTYDELGPNPALTFVLKKLSDTLRFDTQAWEKEGPWDAQTIVRLSGPGSITVDWGDGVVETYEIVEEQLTRGITRRFFAEEGRSASVTLTGDLDKIVGFNGWNARYHNLEVLPNVEDFAVLRSDVNPIPVDTLDLRANYKLKALYLEDANHNVLLGEGKTALKLFWFRGTLNENQIIPAIEAHIRSNNLIGGTIDFFHGPLPSEANLDILRGVRDDYGWQVLFDYVPL